MSTIWGPNVPITYQLSNSKTLSGSNTTVVTPIFRITGTVRFIKLYGIVTTAIGSNHTAGYFRMNDQTTQADITLNTGSTLSSFVAGSMFGKFDLAAVAMTVKNASAGRVIEPTTLETLEFSEFSIVKKNGANTDIEYIYTTTETPTSGVIQFFIEYQPLSANGAVAAV